ncbi:hypothetical protein HPB49_009518 [Dermacentor silvarum]|uniref:Uncharacterized protein n=1 Tax=Dermacentor silvarum TaxID=543639 RepID=A0ACB8C8L4_DERSI|nr:hypothetical protein HPB49_009518 [Dermacentor silvarum]
MVSVLPQKRGAQSIHILNVYCPPHLQRVTFAELFYRALQAAARQPLVVKMRQIRGPARITDWSAFHTTPFPLLPSPQDYQAWASYALHTHQSYTRCICTSTSAPAVDPHLLHLWEARHSLTRRWRRYKLNRKLRSRIQALTAEAADYSAQLADTNWVDTCMKAAGQMSSKSTSSCALVKQGR